MHGTLPVGTAQPA